MKKILSLLFACALIFAITNAPARSQALSSNINKPMPKFHAVDCFGRDVNSDMFKGKVLIIDFWASWCPPCRGELPGLNGLQKKYGASGLQVLGFSCDRSESDHKQFLLDKNIIFPSVYLDNRPGLKIRMDFEQQIGQISSIPCTIVVDKTGTIVLKQVGAVPASSFESFIVPLLK